jgi:hypothetical protein
MDVLFGDATTALPTPQGRTEGGALLNSPVPSMDLRGRYRPEPLTASNAIPGLEINPPEVSIKNGKPQYTKDGEDGDGVGGWISRMVNRTRGESSTGSTRSGRSAQYKQVGQQEEE